MPMTWFRTRRISKRHAERQKATSPLNPVRVPSIAVDHRRGTIRAPRGPRTPRRVEHRVEVVGMNDSLARVSALRESVESSRRTPSRSAPTMGRSRTPSREAHRTPGRKTYTMKTSRSRKSYPKDPTLPLNIHKRPTPARHLAGLGLSDLSATTSSCLPSLSFDSGARESVKPLTQQQRNERARTRPAPRARSSAFAAKLNAPFPVLPSPGMGTPLKYKPDPITSTPVPCREPTNLLVRKQRTPIIRRPVGYPMTSTVVFANPKRMRALRAFLSPTLQQTLSPDATTSPTSSSPGADPQTEVDAPDEYSPVAHLLDAYAHADGGRVSFSSPPLWRTSPNESIHSHLSSPRVRFFRSALDESTFSGR